MHQSILYESRPHIMIMAKCLTLVIKYEHLKYQSQVMEMVADTVSHEMKTPLNAILGIG